MRLITFGVIGVITAALLSGLGISAIAFAQSIPWEASPNNPRNSRHSYQNSPYNFQNSPNNVRNAEGRRGRINIVNGLGFVTGYAIVKPDGGINYFNNDGDRLGYSVDGGKTQYDNDGEKTSFSTEIEE